MDFLHFRVTRINLKGNSWQKNCSLFCRFLLFTIKLWPCSNTPTSSLLLWLSNPLHQWVNGGRLYDFTRLNFTQSFVCLSVYPHDISKTDAARITKLDADMVHDESWIPFILGSKSQRSRSRGTQTVPARVMALLWVLVSSIVIIIIIIIIIWLVGCRCRWGRRALSSLNVESDATCRWFFDGLGSDWHADLHKPRSSRLQMEFRRRPCCQQRWKSSSTPRRHPVCTSGCNFATSCPVRTPGLQCAQIHLLILLP